MVPSPGTLALIGPFRAASSRSFSDFHGESGRTTSTVGFTWVRPSVVNWLCLKGRLGFTAGSVPCVPIAAIISVYPSVGLSIITCQATAPDDPGLLTTTIGCPTYCGITWASARAARSVVPPAPKGTRSVIGLAG